MAEEIEFGCPKCGGDVTIADLVNATRQVRYTKAAYSPEILSSDLETDYDSVNNERCLDCGERFDMEEWKKPKLIRNKDVESVIREVIAGHSALCLDNENERKILGDQIIKRLTALKAT